MFPRRNGRQHRHHRAPHHGRRQPEHPEHEPAHEALHGGDRERAEDRGVDGVGDAADDHVRLALGERQVAARVRREVTLVTEEVEDTSTVMKSCTSAAIEPATTVGAHGSSALTSRGTASSSDTADSSQPTTAATCGSRSSACRHVPLWSESRTTIAESITCWTSIFVTNVTGPMIATRITATVRAAA